MHSIHSSLRKAAILLSSLPPDEAEAMLHDMGDEQAAAVSDEMAQLGEIDPIEQESIIAEFMRLGPLLPEKDPPGVELADLRDPLAVAADSLTAGETEQTDPATDRLTQALQQIDPQAL